MLPAYAGTTPEASRDRSSGTLGINMNDTFLFAIFWLAIGIFGARHMQIGNAVQNWMRILVGSPSFNEAEINEDGSRSTFKAFQARVVEANLSPAIKEALEPPFYYPKTLGFWFANVALIAWSFWVFPWYLALLSPIILFLTIRIAAILIPGLKSGFLEAISYGLDRKIWIEEKLGNSEQCKFLTELKNAINSTKYKS